MGRLILTLLATVLCAKALADDSTLHVKLGIIEVPTLSESNGRGDFMVLLRRIEEVTNLKFSYEFGPGQRARSWFEHQSVDGYFPALEESVPIPYYAADSFFNKRILAFSLTPNIIDNVSKLQGKTVIYIRGYTYPPALINQHNTRYVDVSTQEQGLKMLLSKRVDVFIGDYETTFHQISEFKRSYPDQYRDIFFDPALPLSAEPTFIAMQRTSKGKMIVDKINAALHKLRSEGRMPERTF